MDRDQDKFLEDERKPVGKIGGRAPGAAGRRTP